MAIESKHHRVPPVDHVLVSQATRRDAQPAERVTFETRKEEYDHWVAIKRRIQLGLSGVCKAAFSKEQARIRRKHRGNNEASVEAWFKRKGQMEDDRLELVRQMTDAEEHIHRLRPLVKAENIRDAKKPALAGGNADEFSIFRNDGTISWDGVAFHLLEELRAIRSLLEKGESND